MQKIDVIIIGAGAAGLMCALSAGQLGKKVLVLDHSNKVGKKILMSGGGRCNFTNYHISPDKYISHNPHFCKSALSRYTQWDFINLVKKYNIAFHEKEDGQLFCDNSAKDIVAMLLSECQRVNVDILLNTSIKEVSKKVSDFVVITERGNFISPALVIASGGLSIPTMGASALGYQIAVQFGLKVWPTSAALVPFTYNTADKDKLGPLAGISNLAQVTTEKKSFQHNILFTHRGLSGPAILQLSSYWQQREVLINLIPSKEIFLELQQAQKQTPLKQVKSILMPYVAQKLLETFIPLPLLSKQMAHLSKEEAYFITNTLQQYKFKPNGTEGYRTAEVTLGGVDCASLSSKTMESSVPGLYFIGEVVDVTGWLGGYNFQWAWSSGWVAGQAV